MTIYSYPVKILLVDDDKKLLDVFVQNLTSKRYLIEIYSDVIQAEDELNKKYFDKEQDIKISDGDFVGERSINVDLDFPKKIFRDLSKSKEIAVLVIDNEMPRKKGIELLKKLYIPNIYKILLTGKTEKQEVIAAFNSGIIDGYICKSDMELYEKLPNLIEKGIDTYFEKKNYLLKSSIIHDKTRRTALSSTKYIDYIKEFIKNKNIHEYYLIDSQGSYIMFGPGDEIHTILILGEDSSLAHLDIAKEDEDVEGLLKHIKEKKGYIYSYSSENKKIEYLLLDKTLPSLDSYYFREFEGDVLGFFN